MSQNEDDEGAGKPGPGDTQHIGAAELAHALRQSSEPVDDATPLPGSNRAALEAELHKERRKTSRANTRAMAWRALALRLSDMVGDHHQMGVSMASPDGVIAYQNTRAQVLVPSRKAQGKPGRLESWDESYGTLRDLQGRIIPVGTWPLARALGGEDVPRTLYTLDGAPLVISATPIVVEGETWAICTFYEHGVGLGTGLSETSDPSKGG